ncbi:MAG: nuclear transport factor 2 family protein [Pirellulales bacterium]|nr:nuclear transport factor 2 family protein [Pirellulales bacterium]
MPISFIRGIATVVLGLAILAPLKPVEAGESEEKAVLQASQGFYSALNRLFKGDTGPMEQVWSHSDDVTYMGPVGGLKVGWNAVLESWNGQAEKKLGGTVRPQQTHVFAGSTLAVVTCIEAGENIVDGKPQQVSIRSTSTYRKEDGKWKMIGHHTDKLPFLEQ